MITREEWAREASTLETELQKLLELASRGLIHPEEFMHKMLRLHGKGGNDIADPTPQEYKDKYTHYYMDRYLHVTPAWRDAHSNWVDKIESLKPRIRELILHIYQNFMQDGSELEEDDYHGYTYDELAQVMRYGAYFRFVDEGVDAREYYFRDMDPLFSVQDWPKTEWEYNEFIQTLIRSMEKLLKDFGF